MNAYIAHVRQSEVRSSINIWHRVNHIQDQCTIRNNGPGLQPPYCGTIVNIHLFALLLMRWVNPDSKVQGANMGPIWGRQDPGGPHVGPMNFAILEWMSEWHDEFMAWKFFPHYWSFVMGINWALVDSRKKGLVTQSLDVSFAWDRNQLGIGGFP